MSVVDRPSTVGLVSSTQPALRILLITDTFPHASQPTRGSFNYGMACALAEHHRVHVIAQVPWSSEWKKRITGRAVAPLAGDQRIQVTHPWYYYPPKLLRHRHGQFLWWSIARAARQVVSDFKPNVVLSYWLHPDGEAAVRVAREARIPVVVMSGGSDVLIVARTPKRRARMIAVLDDADAVVCVSEHLRRAIIGLGIAPPKIHVVYRGVNRAQFHPGDRHQSRMRLALEHQSNVIVWAGRMVPVKGLKYLVDACSLLKRDGVDFKLYLVGAGPDRADIARRVNGSGLAPYVKFVGSVAHEQLADWYRAADLVVLPSLSEGVPNVLLEAIACGTSFVATDVGGIGEISDPAHDRLVPPASAKDLAVAIRERLQAQKSAEPRRFEPSTSAQSAERLSAVLRGCLDRRTG